MEVLSTWSNDQLFADELFLAMVNCFILSILQSVRTYQRLLWNRLKSIIIVCHLRSGISYFVFAEQLNGQSRNTLHILKSKDWFLHFRYCCLFIPHASQLISHINVHRKRLIVRNAHWTLKRRMSSSSMHSRLASSVSASRSSTANTPTMGTALSSSPLSFWWDWCSCVQSWTGSYIFFE